jgi:acyl-coenzyme A synthetase/AMP-(fatty) acid ligase
MNIFHFKHKWLLIDNPKQNTKEKYPLIRYCEKCDKCEILQLAWQGEVSSGNTEKDKKKIKVNTPQNWLPLMKWYVKIIKEEVKNNPVKKDPIVDNKSEELLLKEKNRENAIFNSLITKQSKTKQTTLSEELENYQKVSKKNIEKK